MSSSSSVQNEKVIGRPVFQFNDPSLAGKAFLTTCPPELTRKTRVIAVCGITDIDDSANPKQDGFFFSDLFLFWHMFKDADVAHRLFYTSCKPSDLAAKYNRYTHGSPWYDRRVVLEQEHLQRMTFQNGWRVTSPTELLPLFEGAIKTESELAAKNGQDLLLCIFGHGAEHTKGVYIGSKWNHKLGDSEDIPQLSMKRVGDLVGKKVKCGIYLSSCYSGGWAYNPNLNLTIMAAAGKSFESYAWPNSATLTHAGTIVSKSLLEALFRAETEESGSALPFITVKDTDTYAQLGHMVYEELVKQDKDSDRHQITFSAQDDAWEKAWRGESVANFPAKKFKEAWQSLRSVPPQPDSYANRHPDSELGNKDQFEIPKTGSLAQATESLSVEDPSDSEEMDFSGLKSKVKHLAAVYLNSFPGDSGMAENTGVNNMAYGLVNGHVLKLPELLRLYDNLKYRMQSMRHASVYASMKDLKVPMCEEFDLEAWERENRRAIAENDIQAKNKQDRVYEVGKMLRESGLFPSPPSPVKLFNKPRRYLAIALVGMDTKAMVEEAIKEFVSIHEAVIKQQAHKFAKTQPESARSKMNEKFRSLGRRLRARSIDKSIGQYSTMTSSGK